MKETIMKETISELVDLVSVFQYRKLFTNDSIIMVGDLEKLVTLINKLEQWENN